MLEFSEHAHFAASEREIPIEWVERVVKTPGLCLQDPRDAELQRFYGPIQEFGNRVLREKDVSPTHPHIFEGILVC